LRVLQFLLIFRRGDNGKLAHPGLIEIYRQMFIADGEQQENNNTALKDFKDKVATSLNYLFIELKSLNDIKLLFMKRADKIIINKSRMNTWQAK